MEDDNQVEPLLQAQVMGLTWRELNIVPKVLFSEKGVFYPVAKQSKLLIFFYIGQTKQFKR